MRFQTPLRMARLIRRYKRFLADMELPGGQVVVAHCANPGSMLGMAEPGSACWLEPVAGAGRKLGWSWKLVDTGTGLAVVDTAIANRVVAEALTAGAVSGLGPYDAVRREVRMGVGSRVDFVLSGGGAPDLLLEVKSVTLKRGDDAEFPDSVTARGTRHLDELAAAAGQGRRAAMLYLLARNDAARIGIAADIDPAYARAFARARDAGVRMLGLACHITPEAVRAAGPVPVDPVA